MSRGLAVRVVGSSGPFCPIGLTRLYFSILGKGNEPTGFGLPRITRTVKGSTMFKEQQATYNSCRQEQIRGLKGLNLDWTLFGLHSGRIGSTVILMNLKFSVPGIIRRVGWSPNSLSIHRYALQAMKEIDEMAAALTL